MKSLKGSLVVKSTGSSFKKSSDCDAAPEVLFLNLMKIKAIFN
jgi:hypothetical protein